MHTLMCVCVVTMLSMCGCVNGEGLPLRSLYILCNNTKHGNLSFSSSSCVGVCVCVCSTKDLSVVM